MVAVLNKPAANLLLPCSKNTTGLGRFFSRIDSSRRSFSLHVDNLRNYVLRASTGIGIALYGR